MSKEPLWQFLTASWRDHVAIFSIATWSGLVTSLHRRLSRRRPFSLIDLAADVLLSGLSGVMVGWLCQSTACGDSPTLSLVAAGIAGHSAPRTLWLLDRQLRRWLGPDRGENGPSDTTRQD
ncbi:MAG: phage holin family protein [Candidatus Contendobacter sp.]